MSKKKRKQFRTFESDEASVNFKEQYICMTKSMITSKKWWAMNPNSRSIYELMKLWAYGRQEFKFSYSLALNYVGGRATFKRAIDQLVDNGYIEIIRISRRPGVGTIYKFSDKWYK